VLCGSVLLLFVCAGHRMEERSYEVGEGARLCRRLAVFGIDGTTFLVYGHLCVKYEKSSLKSASENK